MKSVIDTQRSFEFYKSKSKQSKKYNKIHEILENDLSYLEMIAQDFTNGRKQKVGAKGITVEQVVRVAIIKQVEQLSYDKLYDQLHDNISYRNFCMIHAVEAIPEKTTLWENITKLSAASWEIINTMVVLGYAQTHKIEMGKQVRMDSTGVESNIHHPTDGTLLWDGIRVLSRIMKHVKEDYPELFFTYSDHTSRAKRRHYKIINSKKGKERKAAYRDLLKVAKETDTYATGCIAILQELEQHGEIEAGVYRAELTNYQHLLQQVVTQAKRRVLRGEKVASRDKIVSIFEPHTDILVKGSRDVIFGHKILLSGGASNLILDCIIERKNWSDKDMFASGVDRLKAIYTTSPKEMSLDGGFASKDNSEYAKAQGVDTILFTKVGVTKAVRLVRTSRAYKRLMRFRAGIEGCISTVKRSYGLDRCTWKGWDGFKSYVWSSVVAFNLMTLATILLQ